VQGDTLVGLAVVKIQSAEPGLTKPRGIFQDSVEHRFKVVGRCADDSQNFRGGRLLLQRLIALAPKPRDTRVLGLGQVMLSRRRSRTALYILAASRLGRSTACFAPFHSRPRNTTS